MDLVVDKKNVFLFAPFSSFYMHTHTNESECDDQKTVYN